MNSVMNSIFGLVSIYLQKKKKVQILQMYTTFANFNVFTI